MAGATAAADAAAATRYPAIDVDAIESSGLNPRTHWNDADDKELQESIRVDGVLEPIIVRPVPKKFGSTTLSRTAYQIVAGERRYRAAKAVGLIEIPAIIRDVTDEKLLELALTENIQRRSMHPLDEANGFIKRLEMGQTTPEQLANTLGLSKRYVTDRIRLKKLVPDAAKMLEAGDMSVSHAILLAKLDPKLQDKALDYNSDWAFDYDAPKAEQKRHTLHPIAELKDWIAREVPIDPASSEAQEEFPQLAAAVTEAQTKGATIVVLSSDRTPWKHKPQPGDPIYQDRWQECKKSDKAAEIGVIVQGRRRGERVYFKPVAAPESRPSTSHISTLSPEQRQRNEAQRKRDQAAEARRREQAKHWTKLKPKAIAAASAHIAAVPLKVLIAALAKEHHCKTAHTAEAFLRELASKDATVSTYSADSMNYRSKGYGFDVEKWAQAQIDGMKKAAPAKATKKAKKR